MEDVYDDMTGQAFLDMVCSELPRGSKAVSIFAVVVSSVILCATTSTVVWFRKSLQMRMRFPWLVVGQTACALAWMYLQLVSTGTILMPESTHMSGVCESVTVATYTGGFMLWCVLTCIWMFRHARLNDCWKSVTMLVIWVPVVTLFVWAAVAIRQGFQDLPCVHTPCALTKDSREILMVAVFLSLVTVTIVAMTTVTAGSAFGINKGVWFAMLVAFVALMVCTLSVLTSKGGTGSAHEIGVVYNVCTAVVVAWYNLSQVLDVCIKSLKGVKTDLSLLSLVEMLAQMNFVCRGEEEAVGHPLCPVKYPSLKLKLCEGGASASERVRVVATLVLTNPPIHTPLSVPFTGRAVRSGAWVEVKAVPHRKAQRVDHVDRQWANLSDAGGYVGAETALTVLNIDEGNEEVAETHIEGPRLQYRVTADVQRADSNREAVASRVSVLDQGMFVNKFRPWKFYRGSMNILMCVHAVQEWVEQEWAVFPHLVSGFRLLIEVATWKHEYRHVFHDSKGRVCFDVDLMAPEEKHAMRETIQRANDIMATFFMEPLVSGRYDWDNDDTEGPKGILGGLKTWFISVTGGRRVWRKPPSGLLPPTTRTVRSPAQLWELLSDTRTGVLRQDETSATLTLDSPMLSTKEEVYVTMLRAAQEDFTRNQRAYIEQLRRRRNCSIPLRGPDAQEESSTVGLVGKQDAKDTPLGVHLPEESSAASGTVGLDTEDHALEAMQEPDELNESKDGGAGVGLGQSTPRVVFGKVNDDVSRNLGLDTLDGIEILPPWHKSVFDVYVCVVTGYLHQHWTTLANGEKGPSLTNVIGNLAGMIIDRM